MFAVVEEGFAEGCTAEGCVDVGYFSVLQGALRGALGGVLGGALDVDVEVGIDGFADGLLGFGEQVGESLIEGLFLCVSEGGCVDSSIEGAEFFLEGVFEVIAELDADVESCFFFAEEAF